MIYTQNLRKVSLIFTPPMHHITMSQQRTESCRVLGQAYKKRQTEPAATKRQVTNSLLCIVFCGPFVNQTNTTLFTKVAGETTQWTSRHLRASVKRDVSRVVRDIHYTSRSLLNCSACKVDLKQLLLLYTLVLYRTLRASSCSLNSVKSLCKRIFVPI